MDYEWRDLRAEQQCSWEFVSGCTAEA